jgi:HEAT repeat protein
MKSLFYFLAAAATGLLMPSGVSGQTRDRSEHLGPYTLGARVKDYPFIVVLKVAHVDRKRRTIIFRKVENLKGNDQATEVRHRIGKGLPRRDVRAILAWARKGKRAVCFHDGEVCKTCLGNFWYGGSLKELPQWTVRTAEPHWNTVYVGPTAKLRDHVKAILAGREVVITSEWWISVPLAWTVPRHPIYRDWLRGKKGRVRRIRASLKLTGSEAVVLEKTRYCVGWGAGSAKDVPGIARALRHKESRVRAEAAEDLGQIGRAARAAVPMLRKALGDPDDYVRVFAAEALARIDPGSKLAVPVLRAALKAKDPELRSAAVAALVTVGPAAQQTILALGALLLHDQDNEIRTVAAFALGQLGPEATARGCRPTDVVPLLARAVGKDKSPSVRLWAVRALLKFGPDGKMALPTLSAALRGKDDKVARGAADVIARLGPAAVPALTKALSGGSLWVRKAILENLDDLGPLAVTAAPVIRKLCRGKNYRLRFFAASALLRIDPRNGPKTAVPALGKLLNKGWHVRNKALALLATLGPKAEAATAPLVRLLRQANKRDRIHLAGILGEIGPPAREALPVLGAMMKDQVNYFRVVAAEAYCRISGRSEPAVSVITQVLQKAPPFRGGVMAVETLGSLGPKARGALPLLGKMMGDPNNKIRADCALAFWQIGRARMLDGMVADERQKALGVLLQMLRKGDAHERLYAAIALGHIGPEAGIAVPVLVKVLKNEKGSQCLYMIDALGQIGPGSYLAVPVLVKMLKTKDSFLQGNVIDVLGQIGPGARAAVPALNALLGDEHCECHLEAALALCRITRGNRAALVEVARVMTALPGMADRTAAALGDLGPNARAAVPQLLRALRDNDRSVYLAAAKALRQIDPKAADRVKAR